MVETRFCCKIRGLCLAARSRRSSIVTMIDIALDKTRSPLYPVSLRWRVVSMLEIGQDLT